MSPLKQICFFGIQIDSKKKGDSARFKTPFLLVFMFNWSNSRLKMYFLIGKKKDDNFWLENIKG